MQRLAPRERAAVVLKDAFDMSLEESADVLETTVGAVKSALHRGRERLQASRELVDRFADRLRARDKAGMLALMLENGFAENVGCSYQFGREMNEAERSWFTGTLSEHPEWPEWLRWEKTIVETAVYDGEPILLMLHRRKGVDYLEAIVRFEEEQGRVSRLRSYGFCPEAMREVGEALGYRVNTGLYRYPTPEPGKSHLD